ncbi:DNA cytosine methyltransferase [Methylosinus sporium]|uniref:DNA (cytosine-5-)-methyltransferase n=1 Tax=Methylosinus sporium TaxID=428 RepID=A0A2U1SSV5_METSR|nr:DNA cytosine methyltransferase [Methylosinus sporium]PWB94682.1 hypothetical protein C5689_06355 [Methylosinus sporium]
MTRPLALDLFSGAAGGWSLGLHRAGFTTGAACEFDPWRRAVFVQNFPDARMYDDVRELTADRIISDLGRAPDIIIGSPPCQDASAANTKGKGVDGERTGLFFEAIRLVRDLRPRWVALENVPRLRTRGADRVLGALEEIGYSAWPFVVGADDIRANHERKRVWIIAFDPAQIGRGCWWTRRYGPDGDGAAYPASGDARQSRRAGLALRQGFSGDDDPQCQAAERAACRRGYDADANSEGQSDGAVDAEMGGSSGLGEDAGEPWAHWNGGLAYHIRMDAGLSARVAEQRGLAGAIVAAFGDSVVPQIPEAIGRAIWRVEESLAALFGERR